MLTYAGLGRAIIASALTLTVAPSFAASSATDIYLANIKLDVQYLCSSSKMAAANAKSGGIKSFAASTLRHQGDVIAVIDGWRVRVEGITPTEVASLPLETGRSAVNPTINVQKFVPPTGTGVLMPAAAFTLSQLSAMKGDAFDSTYKATQAIALKRLAGLYEAYMHTGDDAGLRDMAKSELTEVRAELDALDKA